MTKRERQEMALLGIRYTQRGEKVFKHPKRYGARDRKRMPRRKDLWTCEDCGTSIQFVRYEHQYDADLCAECVENRLDDARLDARYGDRDE